jgi:hypothetical protein
MTMPRPEATKPCSGGGGRGRCKKRLVAASLEPTAAVCRVARAAGLYAGRLFKWRRELFPDVFTSAAIGLSHE